MNEDEVQVARARKEADLCVKYRKALAGEDAEAVMEDLKRFCGYDAVCFTEDARSEAFALGARSVYLYIMERLSGKTLERLMVQGNTATSVVSRASHGGEPDLEGAEQ